MASSVKLGGVLDDYIDRLVTEGRYGSRSEVLREGVRLVQQREEWLRMVQAKVERGLADVDAGRTTPLSQVREEMRDYIAAKR